MEQGGPRFNLKAVVQQTGLNSDALRAWERRYGLPTPERSSGGYRLYSQQDIDTVKWLVARQQEGLSISRAVELWEQFSTEGRDPSITPPLIPIQLHHAPERMGDGDEIGFTMWMGPLPVHWKDRVEDVSPTGFLDPQVRGPFKTWVHRHTFVRLAEASTEVLDEVEASLKPHGLWGLVGLAMWLGLPSLFAYRGWRTRRLLEGDAV